MNPFLKFFSVAAPSLVIGGLLLQSPAGHADDRHGPPAGKVKHKDVNVNVTVDGHNVAFSGAGLDGIRSLVRGRLSAARQAIAAANMPPPLRAKVLARFDKVNSIVDRRLAKIDFRNLDQLEAQMEGLGEEIEEAMDGLEDEIEALAKNDPNLKRQLKQLGDLDFDMSFGGRGRDHDDDDDDKAWRWATPPAPPAPPSGPAAPMPPMPPVAPAPPAGYGYDYDVQGSAGYDDSAFDGAALQLRPDQRNNLRAVRQQADAQIKVAKKTLDKLSDQLSTALRNPNAQPAEVNGLVDAISANEATIRKARINSWLRARNLLDARQRGVLERGR